MLCGGFLCAPSQKTPPEVLDLECDPQGGSCCGGEVQMKKACQWRGWVVRELVWGQMIRYPCIPLPRVGAYCIRPCPIHGDVITQWADVV